MDGKLLSFRTDLREYRNMPCRILSYLVLKTSSTSTFTIGTKAFRFALLIAWMLRTISNSTTKTPGTLSTHMSSGSGPGF